jgi:hypothetical protein
MKIGGSQSTAAAAAAAAAARKTVLQEFKLIGLRRRTKPFYILTDCLLFLRSSIEVGHHHDVAL